MMKGSMLTFPIVWNGLIEDRVQRGQTNNINIVFGSSLKLTSNNQRGAISRYLHGDLAISEYLEGLMLDLAKEETRDTLVQHINALQIKKIRNVVSAFHHFLKTEEIKMVDEEQEPLENALAEGNPELYVAEALIIAVKNRPETLPITQEDIDQLRTLEKGTKFPDAFANAKARVHEEEFDPELWQLIKEAQKKKPGCFRKLTLATLKNMDMADLECFRWFCHMILWDISKYPMSPYPVVFEAKDHLNRDANIYAGIRTADYVRLETLGLIAHLREVTLNTWLVTEQKTVFSGSVMASDDLRHCFIVRSKAGGQNFEYAARGWFLTDPGFQIYMRLLRPKRPEAEVPVGFAETLGRAWQDVELHKNGEYRFEIYKLRLDTERDDRKMEIDFSQELLEEKMRDEYKKQTPHYAQMDDEFEREGFFRDKSQYEQYVESFPRLNSVEIREDERFCGFK